MARKDLKHDSNSVSPGGLRQRAERVVSTTCTEVAAMPAEDIQALVHELQVYQIELELQNDELHKTQVDLHEARGRYVDLYDSAPVGYLTLDRKGYIEQANLTAATLLKIERRELIGQPLARFVDVESSDTIYLHVREAFATRTKQSCEVLCVPSAGCTFHAQLDSCVTLHEDLPRCYTTLSDITDRKRAEGERKRLGLLERGRAEVLQGVARGKSLSEVLLSLTKKIELLLPELRCSVLLLDQATKCLHHGAAPSLPQFYNDAVDGLPIGPAVGSCGTAAHTASRVIVADVMSHPYWAKYRELAEQADVRACWSEPVMSLSGSVLGTFAMYYRETREPSPTELGIIEVAAQLAAVAIEHRQAQDQLIELTESLERRVAERTRSLRESEERFELAVTGTSEGIWDWDILTGTERWSEQFHAMLGYEDGEIDADYRTFQQLLHPEDKGSTLEAVQAHLERRTPYDVEFRLRTKSGGYRWFRARGQAIWDETGKATRMAGSIQDISDRKEAGDKLKTNEQLLRRLLDIQENERRMVAHDIHDGFVQDVVAAHMHLQSIHAKLDRDKVQGVMDKVELLLSKAIAEGRHMIRDLRPMILDEAGVVEAILHLVADEQQHAGLSVEFQHDVQFDRLDPKLEGAIFRIVQEALRNVNKHGQTDHAAVRLKQRIGVVEVTVRDQGVGFDPEKVPRDRFGLRGIRERARLLGGTARIESEPGAGTTVYARVRIDAEPAAIAE